MSSITSRLARNGSAISSTSSRYANHITVANCALSNYFCSSVDTSSHNHIIASLHSITNPSWLQEVMSSQNHRHERIAVGTLSTGMAVLTAEMMQMHIQRSPDVRGMLDCLPVAREDNAAFIGWRQKLGTW
ncbi:uncharacterized protein PAC_07033 [Phialocephala subalpina]|uniref:Uncharacterized protein n=1 Tax=Phialocephala subalpina TaxID=576137 RepID=A0A1L7WWJ2_9HELO|nr:uncharacterized protein PAC_07033 [Phialocephala subalpina]